MTYLQSEQSIRSGQPVELFQFEGTYENFYYTSKEKNVTFGGNEYEAIAIKRSEIQAGTQEDDGLDVTVELSVDNDLVKAYGFRVAPPSLVLTIYRFHQIGQYVKYWTGPVNNIKVAEGIATLRSPSALAAALQGSCPSTYYQTPCNHVLFDERCKVPRADNIVNTSIIAINGRTVVVATTGAVATKLKGGEVVLASGERRTITNEAGATLTVNYPFSKIEVGNAAQLAVGCDHLYGKVGPGHCINRFNNGKNFGGFPYIPTLNPFESGIG